MNVIIEEINNNTEEDRKGKVKLKLSYVDSDTDDEVWVKVGSKSVIF